MKKTMGLLLLVLLVGSGSAYASDTDVEALLLRSSELRLALETEAAASVDSKLGVLELKPERDGLSYVPNDTVQAKTSQAKQRPKGDCLYLNNEVRAVHDIFLRPGFVTDMELPYGEKLLRITIGDRERFGIDTFNNAEGDGKWHLYISPSQKNIETNLIVATDRDNYQLRLVAGELFFPMVKWETDTDEGTRPGGFFIKKQSLGSHKNEVEVRNVSDLNFSYVRNTRKHCGWAPHNIFDDKYFNTYFVFEADRLRSINPVIFATEIDGSYSIVPYDKVDDTLVAHKISSQFELRVGNESISFRRRYR